jgi:phosphoglycerol transferase MdoB-like AlkP superfamily enzyme
VLSAVYGPKNEAQSSSMYGAMPHAEMVERVRAGTGVPRADFTSNELPTLRRQVATVRRAKPLNLVIVLEESLGAGFVKQLGGLPLTPNLDRLADQGIWFDQLYATGTRSVRGIEAVVAGFPPTALSAVKTLKAQQNFSDATPGAATVRLSQRIRLRRRIALRQHARILPRQRLQLRRGPVTGD